MLNNFEAIDAEDAVSKEECSDNLSITSGFSPQLQNFFQECQLNIQKKLGGSDFSLKNVTFPYNKTNLTQDKYSMPWSASASDVSKNNLTSIKKNKVRRKCFQFRKTLKYKECMNKYYKCFKFRKDSKKFFNCRQKFKKNS